MNIHIERATLETVERVVPLFNLYRQWYNQPGDLAGARTYLTERIQQNESVIYLAFIEGEAVGFVQLYPIFSSVSMRKAWLLNDLYVDAAARKKGVAMALLNAAKQLGIESKSAWLMLQTSLDNYTAQSVYEKHGWVKEKDFFYTLSLT